MTSTGTVKNFNAMRGYGFITAADGSDVFLHIKSVTDNKTPQQGDTVTFDMEASQLKPGQQQAGNVSGGSGGPTSGGSGVVGTGTMQGQCKSFNPMKGYGFIIGPDGSDIFMLRSAFVDGSTPQAGDTITFDVEPSEKRPGTMQATNATGGTGWDSKGKGKGKGFDMWSMMEMMMGGWGGGYGASKGGWGGGKGGPYGGKGKGKGW